jgi:hypothetical protein
MYEQGARGERVTDESARGSLTIEGNGGGLRLIP